MDTAEGPASTGQCPALLPLLIWPCAAAGSSKAAFLFPEPPALGGSKGSHRLPAGEQCQLGLNTAHTCDHLLGIVGLHVPIVLPEALGIPLPLGPLGVVRVCVILQDDDLSREQAFFRGLAGVPAGVAEMPPAQSQAGNRHTGVPREGWQLIWGQWSRATSPEDAPKGTFVWGQFRPFLCTSAVVRSLGEALGPFWVTANPSTSSQSSQGCAGVKDQLPKKALHQPLFNQQLSSGVRLAWDMQAMLRMPDEPPPSPHG